MQIASTRLPTTVVENLVDESPPGRPSVFIQTPFARPNFTFRQSDASDKQMRDLIGSLGAIGAMVAKLAMPQHKGKIEGLCLVFRTVSKVMDVTEKGSLDIGDTIEFTKLGLKAGLLTIGTSAPGETSVLEAVNSITGVVAKVHGEYHVAPVTDEIKNALKQLPGGSDLLVPAYNIGSFFMRDDVGRGVSAASTQLTESFADYLASLKTSPGEPHRGQSSRR